MSSVDQIAAPSVPLLWMQSVVFMFVKHPDYKETRYKAVMLKIINSTRQKFEQTIITGGA